MSVAKDLLSVCEEAGGDDRDPVSGLTLRQLAYFIFKSRRDPNFSYEGIPMRDAYHRGMFDEEFFTRAFDLQQKWKGPSW